MAPAFPLRLLVIDADIQIRRLLRVTIGRLDFQLLESSSGADGLKMAVHRPPDAFLVENTLPDMSGLEVIRNLRQWTTAPIVVIASENREADKVESLEAGADDYVIKPFSIPELIARLRVALRHATAVRANNVNPAIFESNELKIDLGNRVITLRGQEVKLSPIEFKLLGLLARNGGKVIPHSQILSEVWGPNHAKDTHYLRSAIHQLRQKLETDSGNPQYILTEGHIGYRLQR